MKFRNLVAALALTVPTIQSVHAMNAGELLKEDNEVIGTYLVGIVDMMSYWEVMKGNRDRAQCITDWYFRTDGTIEKVYEYLGKYPDRFVGAIVYALAIKPCNLKE